MRFDTIGELQQKSRSHVYSSNELREWYQSVRHFFEISVIIGCLLVNGEAHPVYQCRCFVRSRTYFYLMHINSTVRNTRRRWHAWAAYPSMNVFGESMGYFVRSRNSALILVANATYNGPTERDIIHVNEYSARSYSETNILRKYYYLPT
ncbi:hypothetical protein ABKN59_003940 [Abortiporus biennis]